MGATRSFHMGYEVLLVGTKLSWLAAFLWALALRQTSRVAPCSVL